MCCQAVCEQRKRLGVFHEKLGYLCGLDRTCVSAVERGVRNPTVWVLQRLARGLGVKSSEILVMAEKIARQ